MLDKIIANKARVKSIMSGKPYEAPIAPVVIPEIPVQPEPEVVHVQPEVQAEPEVLQVQPEIQPEPIVHVEPEVQPEIIFHAPPAQEYPLNHE